MQIEAGPLPEAEAGQSAAKFRAVEDAMEMQWMAEKECAHAGKEPPPYRLSELIGKGSFGRVYKAKGPRQGQIVAVKIMSIEEGDSAAPGESDTFAEILKEVSTLKLLNDSGAKNINTVIDTLLIGQSMWMVTEYCAGGSVSTLMHPTGSLAEKWIIPILREVAVAIFWVHKQGIIHRDIKCANVLITEDGGVQLCDFGVAGIVKTRFEKRSTITGTLQWMAPELFETNVTYGSEVDIWAFGSMAYEVATGLPPNATTILPDMDLTQFGAQLRESSPRLEGDEYSARLKDLIAFCMVPDASQRPRIEEIQKHPYICSTARTHPTDSLSRLVGAFRIWERQGGLRRSLFCAGGAHGPLGDNSCAIADDEGWDYGTMEEADQLTFDDPNHINVPTTIPDLERLPELPRQRRRRNRAPPNLHVIKPPLEKAFDQNTMSDYKDNARAFYNAAETSSSTTLPARRASFDDLTIRES
ncbi:kinase-like domain-containing protein, partial [Bombardia bombarda]